MNYTPSTTVAQFQQTGFTMQNYPQFANQLDVPNWMKQAQVIGPLVGLLIRIIEQSATRSNIRLFGFNTLAENQYYNKRFIDMASLLGGYFHTRLVTGQVNNLNQLFVETEVDNYYQTWLGASFAAAPQVLAGFVNQQDQNKMVNLAGVFANIVNQVKECAARGGMAVVPQCMAASLGGAAVGGGVIPGMGGSFPGMGNAIGNTGMSGISEIYNPNMLQAKPIIPLANSVPQASQYSGSGQTSHYEDVPILDIDPVQDETLTRTMEQTQSAIVEEFTIGALVPNDRGSGAENFINQVINRDLEMQKESATRMGIKNTDALTIEDWKPSSNQRHFTGYHKQRHKAIVVALSDALLQRIQEKDKMNEEDHLIPGQNYEAEEEEALKQLMAASKELAGTAEVKTVSIDQGDGAKREVKIPLVTAHRLPLLELSLESSFAAAYNRRSIEATEWEEATIYTMRAIVPTVHISKESFTDVILMLNNCDTFKKLGEMLNDLKDRKDLMPTRVWTLINKAVTDSVNRAMNYSTGFSDVVLDDFSADCGDFLEILEDDSNDSVMPPLVRSALIQNQGFIIKQSFRTMRDEDFAKEIEVFLDLGKEDQHLKEKKYKTSGFYIEYSLTLLKMTDAELGVVLGPEGVAQILPEYMPEFSAILDKIVLNENYRDCMSFLIRTDDGVTYEIVRAFFGNKTYLLTRLES